MSADMGGGVDAGDLPTNGESSVDLEQLADSADPGTAPSDGFGAVADEAEAAGIEDSAPADSPTDGEDTVISASDAGDASDGLADDDERG